MLKAFYNVPTYTNTFLFIFIKFAFFCLYYSNEVVKIILLLKTNAYDLTSFTFRVKELSGIYNDSTLTVVAHNNMDHVVVMFVFSSLIFQHTGGLPKVAKGKWNTFISSIVLNFAFQQVFILGTLFSNICSQSANYI